ncbi:hypothetical protein BT96DRAFT_1022512 [Gymnopus androsaceus JB14]|uniref:Uncharacterized protein n=1 Tax=Gymnopus androsaceus JB14 TaxID=1447944 RepID=A0A6A4H8P4_9AGAR|nr:hypothetical protein BT96DRAFT_1022512 [Gymnopus androsaceus JB14]
MALTITEDTYPELYLSPREIAQFNASDPDIQQRYLMQWREYKPFLSHFPTETLPKHLLYTRRPRNPNKKGFLIHFGWATTWEQVYNCATKHFPSAVRYIVPVFPGAHTEPEPDPVRTCVRIVPFLREACGLPSLSIPLAWTGPRQKDLRPVIAVSTNYDKAGHRNSLLAQEGTAKLKELVGLEGPPKWAVDMQVEYFPSFD